MFRFIINSLKLPNTLVTFQHKLYRLITVFQLINRIFIQRIQILIEMYIIVISKIFFFFETLLIKIKPTLKSILSY